MLCPALSFMQLGPHVTTVVAESVVMHQLRCLEPEVKVAGSLVTGIGFNQRVRLFERGD